MIIQYFGHLPRTFINKVHQKWFIGSSPSPWKKKRKEKKREASEETLLLEQKKKRTKGKDGEAKIKHHTKDIHPSHTCT